LPSSGPPRLRFEASVEQLKQLEERCWEQVEILVIYIDGQRFAKHHILSAVGVDVEGRQHVLGIASEACSWTNCTWTRHAISAGRSTGWLRQRPGWPAFLF